MGIAVILDVAGRQVSSTEITYDDLVILYQQFIKYCPDVTVKTYKGFLNYCGIRAKQTYLDKRRSCIFAKGIRKRDRQTNKE